MIKKGAFVFVRDEDWTGQEAHNKRNYAEHIVEYANGLLTEMRESKDVEHVDANDRSAASLTEGTSGVRVVTEILSGVRKIMGHNVKYKHSEWPTKASFKSSDCPVKLYNLLRDDGQVCHSQYRNG